MADRAAPVSFSSVVPEGEDRIRRVCDTCGFIDYVNPRIVTGSVAAAQDGRILLCKRAIEPRLGFWTLPAGFMELGETVEEAAAREAREEANAELDIKGVLAIYSIPRIGQVQVMFEARLLNVPTPGPESQSVDLFAWDEIPWGELAFPSVRWALEHWRARRDGRGQAPFGNPPGSEALTR
jgi:ADP-ribose pyrophosphatase YjhB (NUDIX family)